MTEASKSAPFPTTHWSQVIAAGDRAAPEARAALAELCEAYWYPIYALIRCRGHRLEESCDLAQEYFARLLEKPPQPARAEHARWRHGAGQSLGLSYLELIGRLRSKPLQPLH